jgi:hypothetical protein
VYNFWYQEREGGVFGRDVEGIEQIAAAIFEKEPDEIA